MTAVDLASELKATQQKLKATQKKLKMVQENYACHVFNLFSQARHDDYIDSNQREGLHRTFDTARGFNFTAAHLDQAIDERNKSVQKQGEKRRKVEENNCNNKRIKV